MSTSPPAPDESPSIEVVGAFDGAWLVGVELAGKYRVDTLVAEGGFGAVYAGVDLRLDVAVAVKVFKPESAPNDTLRREFEANFLQEARTVARLRHDHIVRLHDVGIARAPDGTAVPWMAMEWLDGETLQQMLRRRREAQADARMAPAEAVALLRPVFHAVAHAHERGVAHRDLKPANIMLVPGRRGVVARVLDFGVAKAFEPTERRPKTGNTVTISSGVAGFTAAYAAVEQIAGTRTGPWTDVHALALILTELLIGRRAYEGEEPQALYGCAFQTERPTPRRFGVDVGPLEPVLQRALSIHTAERHPDAAALLEAIDGALDAMGVSKKARSGLGAGRDELAEEAVSARPVVRRKAGRAVVRGAASWLEPLRERAIWGGLALLATALFALYAAARPGPNVASTRAALVRREPPRRDVAQAAAAQVRTPPPDAAVASPPTDASARQLEAGSVAHSAPPAEFPKPPRSRRPPVPPRITINNVGLE